VPWPGDSNPGDARRTLRGVKRFAYLSHASRKDYGPYETLVATHAAAHANEEPGSTYSINEFDEAVPLSTGRYVEDGKVPPRV
jgi:hypothetical protein